MHKAGMAVAGNQYVVIYVKNVCIVAAAMPDQNTAAV